jgi:lantibiotic leader peptide-processing serine protease
MRRWIRWVVMGLVLAGLAACGQITDGDVLTNQASGEGEGRFVVVLKKNAVTNGVLDAITASGGTVVRTIPHVGLAIVTSASPSFTDAIKAHGAVMDAGPLFAETLPEGAFASLPEDGPTAADDLFNAGLVWGVERVRAPEAWADGVTGSHDTVVAVIDTGIAWNHPDLAPNVVYVDCYTSAGSYTEGACNPYPAYSDHGTHVAGTVAAAFDGGRVVGVGPNLGLAGYNTFEIIPGCGVCSYSDSRWMAMLDAADKGFDVINMSLGGYVVLGIGKGTSDYTAYLAAEKRIARYVNGAGTVMVASSGNESLDLNGKIVHVPGDTPSMVNVGATGIRPNPRYEPDSYDVIAFYSNYGAAVDVAAPGGDCGQDGTCDANRPANWFEYLVLSSIVAPNPTCAETFSCPVGYGWKGGTSMAAPHVSGVVGLIRDVRPDLPANQVKSLLRRTAENLGDRQLFGHGMVDAYAATR